MRDYSWADDDLLCNEPIPTEATARRVALAATAVVLEREDPNDARMLVCNPHPETWNSWMLPYGAYIIDAPVDAMELRTFGALSSYLRHLRRTRLVSYRESAANQIRETLGVATVMLADDAIYHNYSLKFSKTAGVWTAYLFSYHLCTLPRATPPRIAAAWIPLQSGVAQIVANKRFLDVPVADNVTALLAKAGIVKSLIAGAPAR